MLVKDPFNNQYVSKHVESRLMRPKMNDKVEIKYTRII